MANEIDRFGRIKQILRKVRIFSAVILVYITYNPAKLSYFHWAVLPWFDGFFGKGKISAAGPHSLKAFVGVMILIGWFFFLRVTRRKVGLLGILLALAFFGSLGWVLNDYNLLPRFSGPFAEHILLLIISFILMLGVLLPEPKAAKKDAGDKKKGGEQEAEAEPEPEPVGPSNPSLLRRKRAQAKISQD